MPSPFRWEGEGQDVPDWAPVRRLPTEDEVRERQDPVAAGCFSVVVLGFLGALLLEMTKLGGWLWG